MKTSNLKFLILLSFCFFKLNAQMLLPEFTQPQQLKELSTIGAEESLPLFFNNGESVYFYRTYMEGEGSNLKIKSEDTWFSKKGKKGWDSPYRLFRADYIQGVGTVIGTSEDGNRIYLFISKYLENSTERRLVYMDKTGKDKWSEMTDIKVEGLKFEERYYSFYMSPDAEILMISMSPSESDLDEDLYVSLRKTDNSYGAIINLGEQINTRRYEVSPFISKDGKMLYFSSEGHGGFGQADIFVSRRLDETWTNWTKPLNLGTPINSSGSEAYFTMGTNKDVYFTSDRESQYSAIYTAQFTGEFRFAFNDSIEGQFVYKGLPRENVTIQLFDLEDNLIAEYVTDEEGKFKYEKLKTDEVFMVKIKTEDDTEFYGSKIYFADENGKRNKRMIFTSSGTFEDEDKIKEREKIQGFFNYNSLPQSNISLILFDENGFPVDTILTDEYGGFTYMKLTYDQNYSIVPLDAYDETSIFDLHLTDEKGNKTKQLVNRKDQYSFVAMDQLTEEEKNSLKQPEATAAITEKPVKKEEVKASAPKMTKETLYFDFAKNELNATEKAKANKLVDYLKANPTSRIKLLGHTDAIGTEESNQARGLQRANSVKQYLLSRGLVESVISSVTSKGELAPIATNDTPKGRAQNRRVEVEIVN